MARLNRALLMASGLLAGAGTLATAQNATQADGDGLHALMVKAGKMYFGTAFDVSNFNDTQYMDILAHDFGMVTADNSATWAGTEAARGDFDYTNVDQVFAKAKENGQKMRCHALVWHKALPTWGTWSGILGFFLSGSR
jgi:endo-1,4-beta-xylanase